MELSEFLLARIAEDEARARKRMHHAQENYLLLQDPKYLGRVIPGWYEWPEIEADAARTAAECDAKRRIVESHQEAVDSYSAVGSEFEMGKVYVADLAVRLLALPYADHPDYQPEWELQANAR